MLDEELRGAAMARSSTYSRSKPDHERIELVEDVLQHLKRIENKTVDDHRLMALNYERLAIEFFNSRDYSSSATYYQLSISALHALLEFQTHFALPHEDNDYRSLTSVYIDLADAYYHLFDKENAQQAQQYAIDAFRLIKEKTVAETALGDPADNFQAFHRYFEEKTSGSSYLKSTAFLNHQHISMRRFDEAINPTDPIAAMMQALTLSNETASFKPLAVGKIDDRTYRASAIEILGLTSMHVQAGNTAATLETYQQAYQALMAIEDKTPHDNETLAEIGVQIALLQEQLQLRIEESASAGHSSQATRAGGRPSQGGMWSRTQAPSASTDTSDPTQSMQM